MTPFIEEYMSIFSNTESPKIFHLWAALSLTATTLGKNTWFHHGINLVYPNLYVFLIGDPGSRKSVTIKAGKKIIAQSGYETFSSDRTTKEKFLIDFQRGFTFDSDEADVAVDGKIKEELLEDFLREDIDNEVREVFIPADEWLEFFGEGNAGFATLLGTLWDFEGIFRDRLKNSKSVTIPNPIVNILGGCTHDTFKLAFPAAMLGHGFISRLILVFGERSGKKITWPKPITEEDRKDLAEQLHKMRHTIYGQASASRGGEKALDEIYQNWRDLEDVRFNHYSTRRFTQLLKLCLVFAAHRYSTEVIEEDVIKANTVLSYTEQFMPKALGEFGANRNSSVVQNIMSVLDAANEPVDLKELWKQCSRDLEKFSDLVQIIQNLAQAEKIQKVTVSGGRSGFLPKREVRSKDSRWIDFSLLEKLLSH